MRSCEINRVGINTFFPGWDPIGSCEINMKYGLPHSRVGGILSDPSNLLPWVGS